MMERRHRRHIHGVMYIHVCREESNCNTCSLLLSDFSVGQDAFAVIEMRYYTAHPHLSPRIHADGYIGMSVTQHMH